MFNNSALLMIWACYEASAKDFANFIKNDGGIKSSLKFSGVNPIYEYYSKKLGLPHLIDPYIEELRDFYKLRNQIIHSTGVFESVFNSQRIQPNKELTELKEYIKSTERIDIHDGIIHCSTSFINTQFFVVKGVLRDIDHYIAKKKNWLFWIQ